MGTTATGKLVPLDQECLKFVDLLPLSNDPQRLLESMPTQIDQLLSLYKRYLNDQENLPIRYKFTEPPPHSPYHHIELFCKTLYESIQKDFELNAQQYYSKATTMIANIVEFLKDCYKLHYSAVCDIDGLADQIKKRYIEFNLPIDRRFKQLNAFTANLRSSYIPKTMADLRSSLASVSALVQPEIEYCPSSELDDILITYIEEKNLWPIFDQTVQRIKQSNAEHLANQSDMHFDIDIKDVQSIYHLVAPPIQLQRVEEAMALKCSLVRILFDRLYREFQDPLVRQGNFSSFVSRCSVVSKMSASQLKIDKRFLTPESVDLPFCEVVKLSAPLSNCVSKLRQIQFLTNPIDISFLLFECLKSIEGFVKINSLLIQNGTIASSKQSEESDGTTLCFDDIFTIFLPVFALAPPVNCLALAEFLSNVKSIRFSSSFEYASGFLPSAVKYIEDFVKEQE